MASSSSSAALLSLAPDEVHVWITEPERIEEPRLLEAYWGVLSAEEREKQQRFHFEKHRRQYLVSHALVRLTLSRYAPVVPEAWRFRTNEYGRPDVEGEGEHRRLRFNLSHTDGMAIVAVALDAEVGVDVEDAQRPGDMVSLADHYFAISEVAALRALPVSQQLARFFEYWTLKEAYIKARGMGLSLPLGQFAFELRSGRLPRISFDPQLRDEPEGWQFLQLRPSARHQAALAVRRPRGQALSVRCQRIVPLGMEEPPELLEARD